MKKTLALFTVVFLLTTFVLAQRNTEPFTYKIGEFEVTVLPEVQQNVKNDILIGATPEMLKQYAPGDTIPNAVNAFFVRTPGKNVLIDAGFGRKLFENLQMIGITPEQIDIILLTHMHGDHIGSLLDEKGKASFPNAEVYLAKPEHDYWIKTEDRNSTVKTVINTYKNKLHLFEPTELGKKIENLPDGFESMSAYGHTPGHTAYLIGMGKEKMLIWGDLTHAMAIQMPYPQVAVTYDTDPNGAIASRKRILEYVFRNNIPIGGMHIAFPGMGKITREGKGYIFIPMIEQKKK